MTDAPTPKDASAKPAGLKTGKANRLMRPLTRAIFWVSSLAALSAAAVALFAGAGAGWHGVVLLSGIAASALLLMYALAAGDAAGRSLGVDGDGGSTVGLASLALDAISDPVLITDTKGAVRWANAAYRALCARRPGGAASTPVAPEQVFAGAASGPVYRLTRAALQGQPACEVLGRIDFNSDEAAVFAAEVEPMTDGGAVWRFRPAQGDDFEGGEETTPDWADHAPVGLFLADSEGRLLAANTTLRNWVGADAGQALKLGDILAGDGARLLGTAQQSAEAERFDARLVSADGGEMPIVLAVTWTDDRPALARGVIYGVSTTGAPVQTRATRTEAGDTTTEAPVESMFGEAPFGVARLDGVDPLQAVVMDANPALLLLTGGMAVPGVRFADLFEEEGKEPLSSAFATALAGSGEPGEASLRHEDGPRPVHVFMGPSSDGRRAAYIVDISAWKDLETQVAQAGKMQAVGQLASGVAHDFNNMLTAIRLNVGELLSRHPVGDPSYQDLQQINATVTRQAGLVRKLLAFSRKQTFRNTVFDVADVLSDCSVLLGQILEETVRLDIRHGRELPMVRADRHQIDNILVNLATNARDAMKASGGGQLTIRTEGLDAEDVRKAGNVAAADGRWAAIHVTDTGSGMDAETRKKIFEPFFTTKAAGEGTGLGLATVYGIVKQTGGYLFVDSEVGKGTTFSIYLPGHIPNEEEEAEIAAEEAAKTEEVKPADLAGRGRILFVEDEDAVRGIAAKTLVKRGYEVVEACDGEEALEILEEEPESFDLLISDVVMPGLDGPSLLKEARPYLGNARIIFISGYAKEEFSDTLSSDLEISFLPKPFDIQQLAERVKQELGRVHA